MGHSTNPVHIPVETERGPKDVSMHPLPPHSCTTHLKFTQENQSPIVVITLPQELVEVSQWILFWNENAGNCYKHLKKFTTVIMKRNVYKEKRLSILFHRETPQEHVKVTK
jgi:hypothetical protein